MMTTTFHRWIRRIAAATALSVLAAGAAHAQSESALKRIRDTGTARIGVLIDFPPFGMMNEKNEMAGFDIDVAKLIAARMGVKAELVPVTGPNRIPFLQTGRIDMAIASLAITKQRAEQVLFSEPYAALQAVLYARKNLKIASYGDLGGKSVGVARSSPQDTVITRDAPKDTRIQRFDQISAVYQAVLAQQVDAAAIGALIALELDKQIADRYESKFVMYQQVQGVAMRKGDTELGTEIDRHIAAIKQSGELNAINRKWLGTDLPELKSTL